MHLCLWQLNTNGYLVLLDLLLITEVPCRCTPHRTMSFIQLLDADRHDEFVLKRVNSMEKIFFQVMLDLRECKEFWSKSIAIVPYFVVSFG